MIKYSTIKSILGTAVVVVGLASPAIAQEAPSLIGNYSANVEGAINPQEGKPATASSWSTAFGFALPRNETRPVGNYSANIRVHDIRGK